MKSKITNQLTLLYFKSMLLYSLRNVGIFSHFEMDISLTYVFTTSQSKVNEKCFASSCFIYLIYKPYNHIDQTVVIGDSFSCKCLFDPPTDLIELKLYLADIAFV